MVVQPKGERMKKRYGFIYEYETLRPTTGSI